MPFDPSALSLPDVSNQFSCLIFPFLEILLDIHINLLGHSKDMPIQNTRVLCAPFEAENIQNKNSD